MDSDIKWLFKRQEKLEQLRANFEVQWSAIAERVIPILDNAVRGRAPGTRRDTEVYDSTAPLALPVFSASVGAMLTPRGHYWHSVVPVEPALRRKHHIKIYCEEVRDILFAQRYRASANFGSNIHNVYESLGAFGTATLETTFNTKTNGLGYQSIPLTEVYIAADDHGLVDTHHRKFCLTAKQAAQRWKDNPLPEAITKALEKNPEQEFDFLHCVFPNEEYLPGRWGVQGMPFISFELSYEGQALLRRSGYHTSCFNTTRHRTGGGEVYGRSPAQDALADIRTLNAMSKTSLRYGERSVDPSIVTADVDSLAGFSTRPGAVNAGYVDSQGRVLAQPLLPGGNPNFTLELMDQRRQAINRSFLVTLFQILIETPRMTATEVLERAQEKGALLAPTMERQETELLGPTINRELDLLARRGMIPKPPPELIMTGGARVEYDNPYTQSRKSGEALSISRLIETVGPLAQLDPERASRLLRRINADEAIKVVSDALGVPARVIHSDAELAAMDAAEMQKEQMANLLTAAPIAAQTAKDLAQADAASQNAPV